MKTKIKTKNKIKTKIKLAVFLFFALAQIGWADISLGASIISQDMIELINKSRAEAGLDPLAINEKLAEAAREKADDMFKLQYFDHNSPNGTMPWDFIKAEGYEYKYAGENLAIDFISASGAHKALMESSSHRDNILNVNYTEIGIAVKEDIFEGNKSIIIVEEFASPLYKKINADYSSSENIELILEEKADEINNPPKREEEIIAESLEVGINMSIVENENEADSPVKKENENKQENLKENETENAGALYFLKDDAFEKWFLSLFPSKDDFDPKIAVENKKREIGESTASNKPIFLVENLNNERVMGLVNEVSSKEAYLNKFKYQTGLSLGGYFQDELSARVLMIDLFLAILLIFDFWFLARLNARYPMLKIN